MTGWNPTAPRTWRQYVARWTVALALLVLVLALASFLVRPDTVHAIGAAVRLTVAIVHGIGYGITHVPGA